MFPLLFWGGSSFSLTPERSSRAAQNFRRKGRGSLQGAADGRGNIGRLGSFLTYQPWENHDEQHPPVATVESTWSTPSKDGRYGDARRKDR